MPFLAPILGGLAAGAGSSLLGGLFGGGGGGSSFQPTPLMEAFSKYGRSQLKANQETQNRIIAEFQRIKGPGGANRGAAEAFLESMKDRYANSGFIDEKLAKSYGKDVDYLGQPYWRGASDVYSQAGLTFDSPQFSSFVESAKAKGIRSPQAFADMLRQDLVASGKMPTAEQERLSYIFGSSGRDAQGRLTNKYAAIPKYTPPPLPAAITYSNFA